MNSLQHFYHFRQALVHLSVSYTHLIRESTTPIVPIYTYEAIHTLEKAKELYEAGVYVNPVLPPATAPTECLLRTSYMATHTEALIDEAADIIRDVLGAAQ